MTIKRVAKSFTDLNTTLKLAVSGPKAPDVVRPTRAARSWASSSRAGCCGRWTPTPTPTAGPTASRRRCWTSTASRPTASSSASGNLYGVSQMGEIVGVYYNKDKVASAAGDVRRVRGAARRPSRTATSRSRSATSTSSRGIHEFQTVQNQYADKQASRDFVFAKRRRVVRHVGERGGREEAPGVGEGGLLHAGLQRHGLRPRLAAVRQGRGAVPDRRHVAHRRPRRQRWATRSGFFLMPGRRRARPGVARRREPAVGASPRSRRTPTSRPPTSTSSPTRRRAGARGDRTTCRR